MPSQNQDSKQETKVILVTGGTGFVGSALCSFLLQTASQSYKLIVLTRDSKRRNTANVEYISQLGEITQMTKVTGIVNLAGEGIADARWTEKRKKALWASRVDLTESMFDFFVDREYRPNFLLSASAVGFYGTGDELKDEDSGVGQGFAAELCQFWEQASDRFQKLGTRVCKLRFAVVLGANKGVLKRLLPLYKLGLGGPIASGRQGFSWVHIDDLINAIDFCMQQRDLSGAFNLCAPNPVHQREFARVLASHLHRPGFIPTPALALRIAFGQMAEELLIGGQFVHPKRLLDAGFVFRYPEIDAAIKRCV